MASSAESLSISENTVHTAPETTSHAPENTLVPSTDVTVTGGLSSIAGIGEAPQTIPSQSTPDNIPISALKLGDQTEQLFYHGQYEWTTTLAYGAELFRLDINDTIHTQATKLRGVLDYTHFHRYNFEVVLTLNSSPYYAGMLILVYEPDQYANTSGKMEKLRRSLNWTRILPHTLIDISTTNTAVLRCPFVNQKRYDSLDPTWYPGTVVCYNYSTLKAAAAASVYLSISWRLVDPIFFFACDVHSTASSSDFLATLNVRLRTDPDFANALSKELGIDLSDSFPITTRRGDIKDPHPSLLALMALIDKPVTTVDDVIQYVIKRIKNDMAFRDAICEIIGVPPCLPRKGKSKKKPAPPPVADYGILDAVKDITATAESFLPLLALFLDKPDVFKNALLTVDGNLASIPVGYSESDYLPLDPSYIDQSSVPQNTILQYCSQPILVGGRPYTTGTAPGANIYSMNVSPYFLPQYPFTHKGWRGGIVISIDIPHTIFHKGRLVLVVHHRDHVVTINNFTSFQYHIIDITATNFFQFTIPYVCDEDFISDIDKHDLVFTTLAFNSLVSVDASPGIELLYHAHLAPDFQVLDLQDIFETIPYPNPEVTPLTTYRGVEDSDFGETKQFRSPQDFFPAQPVKIFRNYELHQDLTQFLKRFRTIAIVRKLPATPVLTFYLSDLIFQEYYPGPFRLFYGRMGSFRFRLTADCGAATRGLISVSVGTRTTYYNLSENRDLPITIFNHPTSGFLVNSYNGTAPERAQGYPEAYSTTIKHTNSITIATVKYYSSEEVNIIVSAAAGDEFSMAFPLPPLRDRYLPDSPWKWISPWPGFPLSSADNLDVDDLLEDTIIPTSTFNLSTQPDSDNRLPNTKFPSISLFSGNNTNVTLRRGEPGETYNPSSDLTGASFQTAYQLREFVIDCFRHHIAYKKVKYAATRFWLYNFTHDLALIHHIVHTAYLDYMDGLPPYEPPYGINAPQNAYATVQTMPASEPSLIFSSTDAIVPNTSPAGEDSIVRRGCHPTKKSDYRFIARDRASVARQCVCLIRKGHTLSQILDESKNWQYRLRARVCRHYAREFIIEVHRTYTAPENPTDEPNRLMHHLWHTRLEHMEIVFGHRHGPHINAECLSPGTSTTARTDNNPVMADIYHRTPYPIGTCHPGCRFETDVLPNWFALQSQKYFHQEIPAAPVSNLPFTPTNQPLATSTPTTTRRGDDGEKKPNTPFHPVPPLHYARVQPTPDLPTLPSDQPVPGFLERGATRIKKFLGLTELAKATEEASETVKEVGSAARMAKTLMEKLTHIFSMDGVSQSSLLSELWPALLLKLGAYIAQVSSIQNVHHLIATLLHLAGDLYIFLIPFRKLANWFKGLLDKLPALFSCLCDRTLFITRKGESDEYDVAPADDQPPAPGRFTVLKDKAWELWEILQSVLDPILGLSGKTKFLAAFAGLGLIGNGLRGVEKLLSFIGSFFKWLLSFIVDLRSDKEKGLCDFNIDLETVDRWFLQGTKFMTTANPGSCIFDTSIKRTEFRNLYALGTSLFKKHGAILNTPPFRHMQALLQQMTRFNQAIPSHPVTLERVEPVVIWLYGKPGTGKTWLAKRLAQLISYHYTGSPEYYPISSGAKYFNGYGNQLVCTFDDIGQCSENDDFANFCQMISTSAYNVPMAAVEDKSTFFTSGFVICSSNAHLPPESAINCREAVIRRYQDFCYLVEGMERSQGKWDSGTAWKFRRTTPSVNDPKGTAASWDQHSPSTDIMEIVNRAIKTYNNKSRVLDMSNFRVSAQPQAQCFKCNKAMHACQCVFPTVTRLGLGDETPNGGACGGDCDDLLNSTTARLFLNTETAHQYEQVGRALQTMTSKKWSHNSDDEYNSGYETPDPVEFREEASGKDADFYLYGFTIAEHCKHYGFQTCTGCDEIKDLCANYATIQDAMEDYEYNPFVSKFLHQFTSHAQLVDFIQGLMRPPCCQTRGLFQRLVQKGYFKLHPLLRGLKAILKYAALPGLALFGTYLVYKKIKKTFYTESEDEDIPEGDLVNEDGQILYRGYSNRMPTKKRKPLRVVSTDITRRGLDDVAVAPTGNLYTWICKKPSGQEYKVRCLGLTTGLLLVPSHAITPGYQHYVQLFDNKSGQEPTSVYVPVDASRIATFNYVFNDEIRTTETCIVYVGSIIPSPKNIIDRFVSDKQLERVMSGSVVAYAKKPRSAEVLVIRGSNLRLRNLAHTGYKADGTTTPEVYISLSARVDTAIPSGACGSPVFLDSPNMNYPILGVISGGDGDEMACSVITYENLLRAIKKIVTQQRIPSIERKGMYSTLSLDIPVDTRVIQQSNPDQPLLTSLVPESDNQFVYLGKAKTPMHVPVKSLYEPCPIRDFSTTLREVGLSKPGTPAPLCVQNGPTYANVSFVEQSGFTYPLKWTSNAAQKPGIYPDAPKLDDTHLKNCADAVVQHFRRHITTPLRVLTDEETVNGFNIAVAEATLDSGSGRRQMHPMESNTSSGDHYMNAGIKRSSLLIPTEDNSAKELSFLAERDWNDYELDAQVMRIPYNTFRITPKDETIETEKALDYKTRMFYSPDFHYLMLGRKYLGDWAAEFRRLRGTIGHHLIGTDVVSSWDSVGKSIEAFWILDYDISGWDKSIGPFLIDYARHIIEELYEGTEQECAVRTQIFEEMAYSLSKFGDEMFLKIGGIPSGTCSTAEINSLIHILILTYALSKAYNVKPIVALGIIWYVYGDDALISLPEISSNVLDVADLAKLICSHLNAFGLKVSSSIDKNLPPTCCQINSASFLRRKFNRIIMTYDKCYLPQLDSKTISTLLYWKKSTTTLDEVFRAALRLLWENANITAHSYVYVIGTRFFNLDLFDNDWYTLCEENDNLGSPSIVRHNAEILHNFTVNHVDWTFWSPQRFVRYFEGMYWMYKLCQRMCLSAGHARRTARYIQQFIALSRGSLIQHDLEKLTKLQQALREVELPDSDQDDEEEVDEIEVDPYLTLAPEMFNIARTAPDGQNPIFDGLQSLAPPPGIMVSEPATAHHWPFIPNTPADDEGVEIMGQFHG